MKAAKPEETVILIQALATGHIVELQGNQADEAPEPELQSDPAPEQPDQSAAADVERLKMQFERLRVGGTGLVLALQAGQQAVALVTESASCFLAAAHDAKGQRQNCNVLSQFVYELVAALDAQGQRVIDADSASLERLSALLGEATDTVVAGCTPGWLVRMACSEGSQADFVRVHNDMLEVMKALSLDHVAGRKPLGYGEYRDATKPLRRMLKQLGAGSMEAGLRCLAHDDHGHAEEVAKIAGVTLEEIVDEVWRFINAGAALSSTRSAAAAPATEDEMMRLFQDYKDDRQDLVLGGGFVSLLTDLGLTEGLGVSEIQVTCQTLLLAADTDGDGALDYTEFSAFYSAHAACAARRQLRCTLGLKAERALHDRFSRFACYGTTRHVAPELDSSRFAKLCKDTALLGPAFEAHDVDVVFAQAARGQESRRLDFDAFCVALAAVAERRSVPAADVVRSVVGASGPADNSTAHAPSEFVRFHDDKTTFTGVHARGGPSVVEPSFDLSTVVRRVPHRVPILATGRAASRHDGATPPVSAREGGAGTPAGLARPDSRQHSARQTPRTAAAQEDEGAAVGNGTPRRSVQQTAAQMASHALSPGAFGASPAPSQVYDANLQRLFASYATFGKGKDGASAHGDDALDGARFAKLCRETGLVGKKLTGARVDLIFAEAVGKTSKAGQKGQRRMSYGAFVEALELLAQARGCSIVEVKRRLAASEGPHCSGTAPDAVRLHNEAIGHA